jgi:hypothetical protein
MLIGRHLLGRPDQLLADALSMLLFATLAATVWLVFRAGGDGSVTDLLSIDR